MCEFISWVEKDKKVYFLTKEQCDSPLGETLKKRFPGEGELIGHAAIRAYYDIEGGKERECTDFSKPDNFPAIIARAIKRGEFRGMGIAEQLLSEPAWAEYQKIEQPAWAEYQKIEQPAWAEYQKIKQPALAEYQKIKQSALAEYQKIKQSAWAEYQKIKQSAWAEYQKIEQPALAEYQKIKQSAFWDLFANPENRAGAWR